MPACASEAPPALAAAARWHAATRHSATEAAETAAEAAQRVQRAHRVEALGAAATVIFGLSPSVQLEAQLGNLRWVPAEEGALVFVGATLGAGLRF